MAIFQPEPLPLFSYETAKTLDETFKQKPTRLPLELPLQPTVIVKEQEPNYIPIIAIVGILSFFGLLAFLAYLKRS